ncbi:hypothetical protein Q6245_28715, partial [Klebsiella pneumoniae]|nr:hypothetical protein [Klebsiella pneumoniae]
MKLPVRELKLETAHLIALRPDADTFLAAIKQAWHLSRRTNLGVPAEVHRPGHRGRQGLRRAKKLGHHRHVLRHRKTQERP